jgi:NitT/TauT family transport system substrate-binding protein
MMRFAAILWAVAAALGAAQAQSLDKVRFGTNWVAEAEHGGFYQALADGTYKKYGLDVTIVPGGPNVNNRILLPVGKLDFFMSANSLSPSTRSSTRFQPSRWRQASRKTRRC